MGELVRLEDDTAPGVATIRLDRPPMNAISTQVTAELADIVRGLGGRDDIGAVVVWGGPKIFAAGADIKEFPAISSREEGAAFSALLNDTLLALESVPQITLAAVNGFALGGGCELAMATEFRIAGDKTVFGQPEILLGLIPGAGGTQRLMRLVGVTKAKEILYSGRQIDAAEALAIGLASEVVADDAVYPRAVELAEQYARAPKAIQFAKRAMMAGMSLPLDEAVALEAEAFGDCFTTDDAAVGIRSFIEHGPGKASFSRR